MEELSTNLWVFRGNVKVIVIKPTGPLDSLKSTPLRQAVQFSFEQGAEGVLIDFSEITSCDDSGFGALPLVLKTARSCNRKLFLCSLNEQWRSLFELTNMNRVFEIFADRETFIQYFNETLAETSNKKNQEVNENKEKPNQHKNCTSVFRENLTVLIVENNDSGREMLKRRLSRKGCQVGKAYDGVEAMELARSIMPDLILMDLSVDGIDPFELIRQIKADPQIQAIPVIALTADNLPGDREKCLAAGCNDYDTKPVEFPRLWEKIEGCFKKATAP